ncbi:MAG: phage major capsid protein, partial [bacterium]
QWETLSAEHDQVEQRIDTEQRAQRVADSRQRWQSLQFGQQVQPFDGRDVRALGPREARDRGLALLDRDELAREMGDPVRRRAERVIRAQNANVNGAVIAQRLLLTENEHYREAFMQMVTDPYPVLSPEQARAVQAFREFRAMSIGTDASGGFGVPVLIDPTIILTSQGHPNDILGLARVETITTDEWKGVTSQGVDWQFSAEAAATTDNSPTLAQPNVPTHRADGYIPYSIEVGMDYPGFAMEMQTLLTEGYSEILVDKLTQGSGSDQPTGILTALDANTNVEVKVTTAAEISADDVNGLWSALPIRYRNPAMRDRQAWMMHTGVNGVIQQLGQSNDAAFTVDFTADGVTVLKGRRAFENDYFDDLPDSGTGNENLAVVGDWRNFLVAQRAGMSIELVPHVFDVTNNVPTGERAWFAWARVGSDSINDLGFRLLKNNDS